MVKYDTKIDVRVSLSFSCFLHSLLRILSGIDIFDVNIGSQYAWTPIS